VNLEMYMTANTQALVRFPQVYLRVFCHEQNLTKSSKQKSDTYIFCTQTILYMVFSKVAHGWGSSPGPECSSW